jgi:hypothetical protein
MIRNKEENQEKTFEYSSPLIPLKSPITPYLSPLSPSPQSFQK